VAAELDLEKEIQESKRLALYFRLRPAASALQSQAEGAAVEGAAADCSAAIAGSFGKFGQGLRRRKQATQEKLQVRKA